MRARDLAGLPSKGAADVGAGAAEEDAGAAEDETGAAEDGAVETGLAACICSGFWRRCAIVNTSTCSTLDALCFSPQRVNVVSSAAERHLFGLKASRLSGKHRDSLVRNPLLSDSNRRELEVYFAPGSQRW
jgi:hypothetical protein